MRVLVLGASGTVGRALMGALGSSGVGTYCNNRFDGGIPFDARGREYLSSLVKLHNQFTHAVILFAESRIDLCARDPVGSWALNVGGTIRAIDDLRNAGIMPIFASSDAVFDGSRGYYSETSPTTPIMTYGRQKLAVELYLRSLPPPWCALRLTKVVDPAGPRCPIRTWVQDIRVGRAIRVAKDQRFSPIHVDDAAQTIIKVAERNLTGLFHLGGPDCLSRWDLLKMLLSDVPGRHRPRNVTTCSIRDFAFADERPLDTTLDSRRIQAALGITFRPMKEVCAVAARSIGNLSLVAA